MRASRRLFALGLLLATFAGGIPAAARENQTATVDPTEDVERGLKSIRVGKYEQAVQQLQRATIAAPESVPAKLGLAWAYLKKREFGACVENAVKVLDRFPENARAHAIVGTALMRVGFLPEAAASFNAAIKADSGEPLALAGLAELDLYAGNLLESLRRAREAVSRSPREPDFLYLLGQTAARQELYEEAATSYERFLETANDLDVDRRARIRGLIVFYRRLSGRNLYQVTGPKSLDLPMTLSDGRLPTIDVMLNGKGPFRFVVDSGAGFVVVSEDLARRLKMRRIAGGGTSRGVSGTGRFAIVYGIIDRLGLGDLAMENVPTYIRKVHDVAERVKVDGYIGLSVLTHFRLSVDYERKMIELRPAAEPGAPVEAGDIDVPYRMTNGGMLSVRVDIGAPVPLNFIVDTGASSTVVSTRAFDRYNLATKQHKGVAVRVVGAGGVTENVPVVVLDQLQIQGGVRRQEFVRAIVLDLDPVNETAGFEQAGIVGSDLLRFYRIEFDFARSRLVLRPNNRHQGDLPQPEGAPVVPVAPAARP